MLAKCQVQSKKVIKVPVETNIVTLSAEMYFLP
jgi:hypothetical protein